MSRDEQCLGILLPDDGPDDYEWYSLGAAWPDPESLPRLEIGKIPSDGHHTPSALLALGAPQRLAPAGTRLVGQGAQAVVWACTSASFVGGLAWAREQVRALQAALGVPVTSTALAFLEALEALGHDHVDLLSPYPDDVTLRLVSFLREAGVTVRHAKALDCPYAADSHRADLPAEIRRFRDQHPDTSMPLLVPDTAVNTLARLAALGHEAGSVVLTANQVSLWAGLRRLGWSACPTTLLGDLAAAR